MSRGAATAPLRSVLATALPERPFRVELWDGTVLPGTAGGPTFRVSSPRALGHVLRAPGQLGLGRAYVSGTIEVDDIDAALELLDRWHAPRLDRGTRLRLAAAAVRAGALRGLPRAPSAELRPHGRRHSQARDRRAVRHHYDVSNEFFALFLDESMTYSCAVFSRGAETLEEAQRAKLELVCTKLAVSAGDRVLDVGCGWGSFAIHAARTHGARVTGITLSEPQARLARERAAAAGVADLVEIRVADYRDPLERESFDAIASIGMVEHVGSANVDAYAVRLARALRPGGRLLNHGIARLAHTDPEAGAFSERFVFPDAAPLHLSRIQAALERAGLETWHVEGFRSDYVTTLRHWLERLEGRSEEALRLAGAERLRVWRLYLRAARRGFEQGFTSVYQVLAVNDSNGARRVRPPGHDETGAAMPENLQEQLDKYLTDTHSIELQALQQMRAAPDLAGDEEIAHAFRAHERETEDHERRVRERIEARGGGASRLKDAAGRATGVPFVLFAKSQPDTTGKLVTHAFSYEQLEFAAYRLLRHVARLAGDDETVALATSIGDQEESMAQRLAQHFDRSVEASLREVNPDDLGAQLVKYLEDAHAIEAQAIQLLAKSPDLAGTDELAQLYEEHLEETRRHAELIEDRLHAHGSGPSRLKDAALRLGALNWGLFFAAQPDTPGKLAGFAYAFEHLEIGAYEHLKRVAARAGDSDTEAAAEQILAQERFFAERLESRLDLAMDASLRVQGVLAQR